jgi:2-haloacid dehalogenase
MPSRRTFVEATLATVAVSALAPMSASNATGIAQTRRRVLVFDVNETMLDVNALAPQFARVFGRADVLDEWFLNVLLYSNVVTVAGPYADFGTIAGAVLDMVASGRRVTLTADVRQQILGGVRTLPPHADIRPALERLRGSGFRLVTLTNSAPAAVDAQLTSAGLSDLFERSFSVDAVKRFKPAPEPYQHVARELGVAIDQLRLVAAHAWDVLGALRAGCAAAFIARSGKALFPLGPQPDVVASDMRGAADRIIEIDGAR